MYNKFCIVVIRNIILLLSIQQKDNNIFNNTDITFTIYN